MNVSVLTFWVRHQHFSGMSEHNQMQHGTGNIWLSCSLWPSHPYCVSKSSPSLSIHGKIPFKATCAVKAEIPKLYFFYYYYYFIFKVAVERVLIGWIH